MARMKNLAQLKTLQKNVAVSGTPEQLHSGFPVPDGISVVIKAKSTNSGNITIGGSSADALNTSTAYFSLTPDQMASLEVENLNIVYIDATVSGEGVEIIFEQ